MDSTTPSDAGLYWSSSNYWNHITNDRKENKTPFLGPSEKLLDIVSIVKDNEDKIFYEALSMRSCYQK